MLKQFSKERYARYGLDEIALEQQAALRKQLRLYEKGMPCPRILTSDGNVIHMHNTLNDGTQGVKPAATKFVPPSIEQRCDTGNRLLLRLVGTNSYPI